MIMDKKGKLFGKVSIVDIIVLLIIFIGIVGLLFTKSRIESKKYMADGSGMMVGQTAQYDKMIIKLKVSNVRDITRDAIVIGDEVYTATGDTLLGKITDVYSEPATVNVDAKDGKMYTAEVPERYDVTIVVEGSGRKLTDGYYVDSNTRLYYGKSIEIKTTTIQTVPQVTEITIVEE